jgi:hypothetical protein
MAEIRASVCVHLVIKKLKLSHYTPRRLLRGEAYSSYSFSTSVLDGGEWSASLPGRPLPPGKRPPVPILQETRWAPEPVWTQKLEEKYFTLCRESNLDRTVAQPVARHYTAWATRLSTLWAVLAPSTCSALSSRPYDLFWDYTAPSCRRLQCTLMTFRGNSATYEKQPKACISV